jgi:hypothetical protein
MGEKGDRRGVGLGGCCCERGAIGLVALAHTDTHSYAHNRIHSHRHTLTHLLVSGGERLSKGKRGGRGV